MYAEWIVVRFSEQESWKQDVVYLRKPIKMCDLVSTPGMTRELDTIIIFQSNTLKTIGRKLETVH